MRTLVDVEKRLSFFTYFERLFESASAFPNKVSKSLVALGLPHAGRIRYATTTPLNAHNRAVSINFELLKPGEQIKYSLLNRILFSN